MTSRTRYRSVVADSVRWDGFRFRPGDIVISTPPKCGTTWMQRLVALLVFDGPDLPAPISKVSPWLDMQLARLEDVHALLDAQPHRRFIKTHTPFDGLPYDERVSYVVVGRDPRDVAVSARHHMSNMDVERFIEQRRDAVGLDDLPELGAGPSGPPQLSDAEALRAWMDDESSASAMSLPYVLNHLASFWKVRDLPNVELFHYAQLSRDLPGELLRLAGFLGYDISTERASELAAYASFDAMKGDAERVAPNADIAIWRNTTEFFHKGASGQWREVFSAADLEHYDARLAQRVPPDLAAWLVDGVPVATASAD